MSSIDAFKWIELSAQLKLLRALTVNIDFIWTAYFEIGFNVSGFESSH